MQPDPDGRAPSGCASWERQQTRRIDNHMPVGAFVADHHNQRLAGAGIGFSEVEPEASTGGSLRWSIHICCPETITGVRLERLSCGQEAA